MTSKSQKLKSPVMYRRPKFLTVLIRIREVMSREVDYDVDLFVEMVRSGARPTHGIQRNIRGFKKHVPLADDIEASMVERGRAAR